MTIRYVSLLLVLAFGASAAYAGNSARQVRAVRITTPPTIDGFLHEEVWKAAEPATDFVQLDPEEGQPASERTEIRLLYDDDALYIGAMMYDSRPNDIVARLTRRDNILESDRIGIFIDSFHDHQTCYRFGINAAGVKVDVLHYDDGSKEDQSWDAVWDVETRLLPNGWSAEVKLPLRIFRYRSDAAEQEWGINFTRLVTRRGERADWIYIPKKESGFVSRFGHLVGLRDLPSPRHIEVLPFVVSKQDWQPVRPYQRPIDKLSTDAGIDLKANLSNNFLLDATFNPDFGQVEADPSVLNLTTFETFYPEKRPFFIDGTQILRFTTLGSDFWSGHVLFAAHRSSAFSLRGPCAARRRDCFASFLNNHPRCRQTDRQNQQWILHWYLAGVHEGDARNRRRLVGTNVRAGCRAFCTLQRRAFSAGRVDELGSGDDSHLDGERQTFARHNGGHGLESEAR